MGNKKEYIKPCLELIELPKSILLISGRDPFSTNDVKFISADKDVSLDDTLVLKNI